jgi:protein-tyrosine kinase
MSRIHEALKKAEQERAASPLSEQAAASSHEDVTTLGAGAITEKFERVGPVGSTAVLTEAPALPVSAAIQANEYLRFDDIRRRCRRPDWHPDPNLNVFTNPSLSEQGAEQFRTLRSRLYQARNGQSLKTLLITSSVPGEGKTFVAVNLAQAIVRQPDRRALVIDADLRRPRVHALLGAPNSPGLTDYLRGETDEISAIQSGPEGNLCIIPGGTEVTNPSELLSHGRLKILLERLAPVFDWIIVDSPPCLPVADASILAGVCDGALLVVKAGSTPAAVAQRARQELQTRNVVGVVLNAVSEAHMYSSEYYQVYRNGYGSEHKA